MDEIKITSSHLNRLQSRQTPSGLPLRLVQSDDLPRPENSPGEDGMHAKGKADPRDSAGLLEESVGNEAKNQSADCVG